MKFGFTRCLADWEALRGHVQGQGCETQRNHGITHPEAGLWFAGSRAIGLPKGSHEVGRSSFSVAFPDRVGRARGLVASGEFIRFQIQTVGEWRVERSFHVQRR